MLIRFLLYKVLRMSGVVLGALLLMFLLVRAIPGSPWNNYNTTPRVFSNISVDASTQRMLERHYGLDLPLWRQFIRYVIGDVDTDGHFFCGVVCGNLGPSIQQRGRSVQNILFAPPEGMTFWESRFGYSIRLVGLGSVLATGMGVALGLWGATRPNSAGGQVLSFSLAALVSIPNFVLGILAVLVLASSLKIIKVLPDWDAPGNWLIPAIVLAVMPMANIARMTRAAVQNILREEYIRAARAKGLTARRVLWVHAMRNALAPILTFLGPMLLEMFTGLLIVENLYAFPGFGREYWRAVLALDYPLIMGLTLMYATGIVLVNTLIEVLSEALDPRLRLARVENAP